MSSDSTEVNPVDLVRKDEAKKERSDALERLTQLAIEDRRELVKDLITSVFPSIKNVHREEDQKWLKERKVCHSDIFDRYFTYRLGETDISQGELDAFIRSADDRDYVLKFFEDQKTKGLLRAALERLQLQAEEITDAKAETVAKALIDFCDKLPPSGPALYFQEEVSYGSSLFGRMVGGLSSPARPDGCVSAYQLIKRLFEETHGLYVPISFCTELVRLLNKDLGRSLFDITTQQINELSGLVAAKIERLAADEFFNHPRFITLLFFSFRFGDKGRLQERLGSGIENPSHLFRLLRAIAKERDFPLSKNPYIFKMDDSGKRSQPLALRLSLAACSYASLIWRASTPCKPFQNRWTE